MDKHINTVVTAGHSVMQQFMLLPNQFLALLLFVVCIDVASDVSNTFPTVPFGGGAMAFLAFGALGTAFLIMFTATSVPFPALHIPSRLRIALLIGLLGWGMWTAGQSIVVMLTEWPAAFSSTAAYGSDELYFAQYNAMLVLHGQNPYTDDHLASILQYFHTDKVTLLRRGNSVNYPTRDQADGIVRQYLDNPSIIPPELAPASTHSYPAMSFLLVMPVVLLGMPSIGVLQAIVLLALMAMLIRLSPARYRWPMVIILLLDVDGIRSVASSDLAIWPVAGLLFVWVLREHRWRASVIFGLTMAIQQTAWFSAPFYLLWVARRRGWTAGLQEGLLGVATFLAVNMPWIIQSPAAWAHSLFLPMTLPLYPDGSGFIRLALAQALPLWQPAVYSLIEFCLWGLLLAIYWRTFPKHPYAGILFPFVPLLFAWRSPSRYFILLPFLAALVMILTLKADGEPDAVKPANTSTK